MIPACRFASVSKQLICCDLSRSVNGSYASLQWLPGRNDCDHWLLDCCGNFWRPLALIDDQKLSVKAFSARYSMENLLPLADRQDPISVAVQLSCSALDRQAEKKTGYFTVSEKKLQNCIDQRSRPDRCVAIFANLNPNSNPWPWPMTLIFNPRQATVIAIGHRELKFKVIDH